MGVICTKLTVLLFPCWLWQKWVWDALSRLCSSVSVLTVTEVGVRCTEQTLFLCFSAYCSGMWLAALRMQVEMADILGLAEDKEHFSAILDRGKKSFEEKLWNGQSNGGNHFLVCVFKSRGVIFPHWCSGSQPVLKLFMAKTFYFAHFSGTMQAGFLLLLLQILHDNSPLWA